MELEAALSTAGFQTRRVAFNAGDRLFLGRGDCRNFSGAQPEWETWLRFEIAKHPPDAIILFGSSRPAHVVARRVADTFGIDVLSLEEGYLRSGYISCELGGNNQNSPLTAWEPGHLAAHTNPINPAPASSAQPSSFASMAFWAATYYLARDFASKESDIHLFHRPRERIFSMAWQWGVHMLRRGASRISEYPVRRALRNRPGYILVPLQVSSDSQLRTSSRGWSVSRLVDASLMALRDDNSAQQVVFKLHPLERGSADIKRMIFRRASELGVERYRIQVLHSGRMSELTRQSSGMIVINSTSAFSALHHDVPVLVLGQAVFRHSEIVTLGTSEEDVLAFFKLRHTKSPQIIEAFFNDLKSQSLIPGDFYVTRGRQVAITGILDKLQQLQRVSLNKKKARP